MTSFSYRSFWKSGHAQHYSSVGWGASVEEGLAQGAGKILHGHQREEDLHPEAIVSSEPETTVSPPPGWAGQTHWLAIEACAQCKDSSVQVNLISLSSGLWCHNKVIGVTITGVVSPPKPSNMRADAAFAFFFD